MIDNSAFVCTDGGCGIITILYFVLLPLAVIIAISLVLYAIIFLFRNKKHNVINVKSEVKRYLLILGATIVIVGFLIISFGVIPTLIKDKSSIDKQDSCAKEVGYSSPGDDNSSNATAESQSAYRLCLNSRQ